MNGMTEAEERLAKLLWECVPISSAELVQLGKQEMKWKKSTTYTMIKRLERKGFFKNEGGQVQAVISQEDYFSGQSRQFVEDIFEGSLPRFLTAFTRKERLRPEEVEELRQLIQEYDSKES